jgi:hypothetical protein
MVLLAGNLSQRLVGRITQHLATVELAEVDRFGSVAVGFGPGLCDFVNHPRRQLVFTLAHDRRHTEQQGCAIGCGRVLPRFESFRRFFDGAIRELFGGFVEASDYLRAICGIETFEEVAGFNSFAADYEWILASKFALHFRDRRAH